MSAQALEAAPDEDEALVQGPESVPARRIRQPSFMVTLLTLLLGLLVVTVVTVVEMRHPRPPIKP